jgi:hypothetical protein
VWGNSYRSVHSIYDIKEGIIMGKGARVKCRKCGDIITHTHDLVRCKCGAIFVDGGSDYMRCGWDGTGKWEDYAEVLIETQG